MCFSLRFCRNSRRLEVLAKALADLGSAHMGEEEMCWFRGVTVMFESSDFISTPPSSQGWWGAVKVNIL